jgi:ABC-type branched-subunit amino acid transport system ATPase component
MLAGNGLINQDNNHVGNMKKYNKQRLFEVMGRLDNNFKSNLNENTENNLSDVVAGDIIKLIFNQQELQVFQQAMQTDASDFNADVELNPMANHESNSLRVEIQKVLQSKGVQVNEETINFLKFEVWNFLI